MKLGLIATLLVVFVVGPTYAQPKRDAEQLQQRLKRFPEADTDGDGVLTEAEARAHQQKQKQAKAGKAAAELPVDASLPSFAEVAYGPHARNRLDLWRAKSDGPTPVLVFFHGGSFKAGDKANVLARPIFAECLQAGISVVSVNYRFSTDAPFPAQMHDGARAVQFVRAKRKSGRSIPRGLP